MKHYIVISAIISVFIIFAAIFVLITFAYKASVNINALKIQQNPRKPLLISNSSDHIGQKTMNITNICGNLYIKSFRYQERQ